MAIWLSISSYIILSKFLFYFIRESSIYIHMRERNGVLYKVNERERPGRRARVREGERIKSGV